MQIICASSHFLQCFCFTVLTDVQISWQVEIHPILLVKIPVYGSSIVAQSLRIQLCHCYSMRSVPGQGTYVWCNHAPPQKKEKLNSSVQITISTFFFLTDICKLELCIDTLWVFVVVVFVFCVFRAVPVAYGFFSLARG